MDTVIIHGYSNYALNPFSFWYLRYTINNVVVVVVNPQWGTHKGFAIVIYNFKT